MIIGFVLTVGVLVVLVGAAFALRRYTLDEAQAEERMEHPGADVLTYAVPAGQDPAVLNVALTRAGFESTARLDHGTERLYVVCPPPQRGEVRRIIHDVHRTGIEGSEMVIGRVRFDDEP